MIIEKGKYYLQVKEGYVTDAIEYNANLHDYQLYQAPNIPSDILNQCYQLVNGKLVLDEAKHTLFLEEVERQRLEFEAEQNEDK